MAFPKYILRNASAMRYYLLQHTITLHSHNWNTFYFSLFKAWMGYNVNSNHQKNVYSLVPIRRHGSINRHTSYIWPCTFPEIWGVTIIWINTQIWSTSRGTFDKNNSAPIEYTFEGVSINWIKTFSMPWGMTNNWNRSSNWHQRIATFVNPSNVNILITVPYWVVIKHFLTCTCYFQAYSMAKRNNVNSAKNLDTRKNSKFERN